MSVLCLVLLFFVYQFGVGSSVDNGLPVGDIDQIGNEEIFRAYSKDFPYMVEVIQDRRHICGGVLLKLDIVVTAAECFSDMKSVGEISRYMLTVGNQIREDRRGPTVQRRRLKEVVKHNAINLKEDIALVKSKSPFKETDYVKSIALPAGYESYSFNGEQVIRLGWGTTGQGIDSNVLLKVNGYVPNSRKCLDDFYKDWKPNERTVLCIEDSDKGALCYNDAGGPTVVLNPDDPTKDIFVGITLSGFTPPGFNCYDTKPTVVANMVMYLDWINVTLQSLTSA